jgi:hypothetical protein
MVRSGLDAIQSAEIPLCSYEPALRTEVSRKAESFHCRVPAAKKRSAKGLFNSAHRRLDWAYRFAI